MRNNKQRQLGRVFYYSGVSKNSKSSSYSYQPRKITFKLIGTVLKKNQLFSGYSEMGRMHAQKEKEVPSITDKCLLLQSFHTCISSQAKCPETNAQNVPKNRSKVFRSKFIFRKL